MKNYILDTNVLLHDPNSMLSFEENSVLIPIEVIEEIDRFKRESSELGQNARTVSRMLDSFRDEGRLSEGVKLPTGEKLGGTEKQRFLEAKVAIDRLRDQLQLQQLVASGDNSLLRPR